MYFTCETLVVNTPAPRSLLDSSTRVLHIKVDPFYVV